MSTEPNPPVAETGPRHDWTCWCSLMLMLLMFLTIVLFGLVLLTQHRSM